MIRRGEIEAMESSFQRRGGHNREEVEEDVRHSNPRDNRRPGAPQRDQKRRNRGGNHYDMESPPSNASYHSDEEYSRNRKRKARSPSSHSRRQRSRRNDRRHRRRPRRRSSSSEASRRSSRESQRPRAGVVSEEDEPRRNHNAQAPPEQQQRRQHPTRSASVHDDSVGHFRGRLGTVIGDRYRLEKEVGLGTFGRVVECLNLRSRRPRDRDQYVAIKIVRSVKRYFDSALIEARIVQDVNRRGGRGLSHCVVLHDDFTFNGHFCMVFESLGPSLYDFLKRHKYQPFPMVCVQDFAIQLLETLEFLHSFRLCHTDLKIENILLMNDREVSYGHARVPESTKIKLIDFGGACYDSDKKSTVINTRQYRAPEVILSTGWSMPSDMWSAGCILAELYRGELLFATHDNTEHLALVERTIGLFPRGMVKASQNNENTDLARVAFDSSGRHRMERVLPNENASFVKRSPRLESLIRNEDAWFLNLLRMILVIDPHKRATAHECLKYLGRIRRDVVRYN